MTRLQIVQLFLHKNCFYFLHIMYHVATDNCLTNHFKHFFYFHFIYNFKVSFEQQTVIKLAQKLIFCKTKEILRTS